MSRIQQSQIEEYACEEEAWLASMIINIAMKHGVKAEFDCQNQILSLKGDNANALEAFYYETERSFLRIRAINSEKTLNR